MLYKKLITITIATCAFLTKPIFGATYRATLTGAVDITCTGGTTSTCNIYCDEDDGYKSKNIDCNNAGTCNFYCTEKKCAEGVTLTATNSNTLNVVVGVNGEECMKSVSVYTPQYGDANFDMGQSKKGLKGMKVYAGDFATNIIIDIPGNTAYGDDMKDMEIYASTADFVSISMDNGLEWQDGILECPVNSPYNGPEISPCMVDAGTAVLNNVDIDAPDGIPKGVWVEGGSLTGGTTIKCTDFDVTDFSNGNNCWNTLDPTTDPTTIPTRSPTPAPTTHPTPAPTKNPTPAPTTQPTPAPTPAPTTFPTPAPTTNPTPAPTKHPTPAPTTQPTPAPTKNPTPAPTKQPTPAPTKNPTPAPTSNPTHTSINPTKNPTPAPTQFPTPAPTINPTPAPTINPTPAPTDNPTPAPTANPTTATTSPTNDPTNDPTSDPTNDPTNDPTIDPTKDPTIDPTIDPTNDPTIMPTPSPILVVPERPSISPTLSPIGNTELEHEQGNKNGENEPANVDSGNTNGLIVMLGIALGALCIVLVGVLLFIKYKRKKGAEKTVNIMVKTDNYHDAVMSQSTTNYNIETNFASTSPKETTEIEMSPPLHPMHTNNGIIVTPFDDGQEPNLANDEFEVIGDDEYGNVVTSGGTSMKVTLEGPDTGYHESDDDVLLMNDNVHVTAGGPMDDEFGGNNMKAPNQDFGQMLGDDTMVQNLVMDDILDEMEDDKSPNKPQQHITAGGPEPEPEIQTYHDDMDAGIYINNIVQKNNIKSKMNEYDDVDDIQNDNNDDNDDMLMVDEVNVHMTAGGPSIDDIQNNNNNDDDDMLMVDEVNVHITAGGPNIDNYDNNDVDEGDNYDNDDDDDELLIGFETLQ